MQCPTTDQLVQDVEHVVLDRMDVHHLSQVTCTIR
jgi:hypothetical protein